MAYPLTAVVHAAGVLDAYGIPCAHVVGVSAGGAFAQLLALDHPGQFASLTLVSARPVAPGPVDPDLPGHAPEMEQLFGMACMLQSATDPDDANLVLRGKAQ